MDNPCFYKNARYPTPCIVEHGDCVCGEKWEECRAGRDSIEYKKYQNSKLAQAKKIRKDIMEYLDKKDVVIFKGSFWNELKTAQELKGQLTKRIKKHL